MKPLNNDDPGCNYTTSNCVLWQGRDLDCIKLCKGDTVSDVVYKLATELCEVLDILKISSYDLSCFNLTSCAPEDFKELIQFLIGRICKLEECTGCIPNCDGTSTPPVQPGVASGCPDCVVAIAPCFYFQNALGDTITSMQLIDYVTAIGNRICSDVQTLSQQQKTVNNHEVRIVVLEENVVTPYVPPTVTPVCVLPAVPTEMDVVLSALESQFCDLRAATGTSNQIFLNISKQCSGLNSEKQLNGSGGTMASLQGWSTTVNTLAQAFGNMWLTMCDVRQAVKTIQINCCPTGCDGIELTLSASLSGDVLSVYPAGIIPVGFVQCFGSTNVKISDSNGNSINTPMDLIGYLNNISGFPINLSGSPINTSLDLTIEIEPCLSNPTTKATCQSYLTYTVVNQANCPSLSFNVADTSITYNFTSNVGDYTYNIQLWDGVGATMISNQIQVISGIQAVSGQFIGLSASTIYKIRVVIQPTACPECEPVACPFTTLNTNPLSCPPPTFASSSIDAPIVYLGDACGFGALAGTTVTNTGVTTINGDLGLDPGSSITGAPIVTGSTEVNTAAAIAAKVSLIDAYNQAAGASMTFDLTGIDLGGLTLSPGVYFFSAGAVITGTLTLDGAGTYIFQIGTTLVTNGGLNVILTGGATADQVFFQVGSSATLGTGTTFVGIVMALTSISVDGGTVDGALMARNGALTFTAGTTINYIGC